MIVLDLDWKFQNKCGMAHIDLPHGDLLQEIFAFCDTFAIKRSDFGRQALNDTAFVLSLERGRQCLPNTIRRVRTYMRDHEASASIGATANEH